MFQRLATALAYAKAPKATMVLKHPVKGTKALVFAKGLKAMFPKRRVMTIAAAAIVPVAAVAYKLRHRTNGASGGSRK